MIYYFINHHQHANIGGELSKVGVLVNHSNPASG